MPNLTEPVAVAVSLFDRALKQKLTADIFVDMPLSGAAHYRVETRHFLFSVSSASKDTVVVFRLYKMWRAAEKMAGQNGELSADEKRNYANETQKLASDPVRSRYERRLCVRARVCAKEAVTDTVCEESVQSVGAVCGRMLLDLAVAKR